jgi:predicted ATPase
MHKRIGANRYELQAVIGTGGMGTVYRGIDTHTQNPVAIKELKAQLAEPDMIERFRREGEALRELNHPNIVKMLDAFEEDGLYYLVLDYVQGGDLSAFIRANTSPIQTLLTLAIDLVDALTRAHKLGIIHRDLKPANVLIGADGALRLTDFGVAQVRSKKRLTESDAIVGTIDYLPPEALQDGQYDERGDIWAFGVMLCEMLTGKCPFTRETIPATITAILTAPLPNLESLVPHAPIDLIDLVYRLLERDPQARIRSIRHVGAMLEDMLHGRTGNVPATSRFETPIEPWQALPKHNLPIQTTPFVGREEELTQLDKLLADNAVRLVTIVASGGMGKTRLSLECAERAIPHFADGVYCIELAPLVDSNGILSATATAIGYQFQNDGREMSVQLADFLQDKTMLLVFDNFEHLLSEAHWVSLFIKTAPKLNVLVTSRQRLDQAGETLFHLREMDFPTWETPADALTYASVQLFVHSAKRASPSFELNTDNLDSVARICRLVGGMPLGLVLSAGWLAMLSPQEIASELQRNSDLLSSDSQQIPSRQQSIRTVMDYSWHQMTEGEQQVFMRLSVFRGGFTREASQAIAGATLQHLLSLVNKSLIRRNVVSGRFDIHELLRQYAQEQCQTAQVWEATRHRHAHYFGEWLAQQERGLQSTTQLQVMDALDADEENIQASWHYLLEHPDVPLISRFLQVLTVLHTSKHSTHIIQLFEAGVARLTEEPLKTLVNLRLIVTSLQTTDQLPHPDSATYLYTPLDDPLEQALQIYIQAFYELVIQKNFERALALIDQTILAYENLDEPWWVAAAWQTKGFIFAIMGAPTKDYLYATQQSHDRYKQVGADWSALGTLNNLSIAYCNLGDIDTALALIHQLNQARRKRKAYGMAMVLSLQNEARYLEFHGLYAEALAFYIEAEPIALRQKSPPILFENYCRMTAPYFHLGQHVQVEALFDKCQALIKTQLVGTVYPYPVVIELYKAEFAYLGSRDEDALAHALNAQAHLDPQKFPTEALAVHFALGLGYAKTGQIAEAHSHLSQALAYPAYIDQLLVVVGFAELANAEGDFIKATYLASALSATKALRHDYHTKAQALLANLEEYLPAQAYEQAVAHGKTLDLKAVIQALRET